MVGRRQDSDSGVVEGRTWLKKCRQDTKAGSELKDDWGTHLTRRIRIRRRAGREDKLEVVGGESTKALSEPQ
jgi:hypothetical protein